MKRAAGLLLTLATCGCAAQVTSDNHFVSSAIGPVGDFIAPVGSVQERKFAGIERQRFDFSCGSAALATLLRYHYDYDVHEAMAFRGMWARGDQAQIRKVGFSLLDMKRWLGSRGISADGYKVPLDQVAKTGIPGIALISIRNYRHFVVVKGVTATEVLVGDPASGLVITPRAKFEAAWNGIYFVLSSDQDRARRHFNRASQWGAYARAPGGQPFSEPLSQQALMLTAPFYGDIS